MRNAFASVVLLLLLASPAHAWSAKEHIFITRIAVERLVADPKTPPAMKQWLLAGNGKRFDMDGEKQFVLNEHVGPFPRGADGMAFWAVTPDLVKDADRRQRVIEPYNTTESKLHFLDMELINADPAKRKYADDLANRPAVSDFPRDINDTRYKSAGMLPFAVEITYAKLVQSIRDGRLMDKPGQYPRDDHAIRWAGVLSHYLEDNTQPQHATEDFRSQSYFKSGVRPPDVHPDFEYRLFDDLYDDHMDLRQEFWPIFVKAIDDFDDPVRTNDPWKATIEVASISYEALPVIGRAALAAYPDAGPNGPGKWRTDVFFHYRGKYLGREMSVMEIKAHQLAWGVRRVERVLRQAWDQAHP